MKNILVLHFKLLIKDKHLRKNNYNSWLQGNGNVSANHKLFNNIKKYGWDNFRIELIIKIENCDKHKLYRVEGEWIRKLDTYNNGLNSALPRLVQSV